MLTEHFRCLPPIIQFSNQQLYDVGSFRLRDSARTGLEAGADGQGPERLSGRRPSTSPRPRSSLLPSARMCDDPAYDGMDFGVVSLLGSSQSKHIWDKLSRPSRP